MLPQLKELDILKYLGGDNREGLNINLLKQRLSPPSGEEVECCRQIFNFPGFMSQTGMRTRLYYLNLAFKCSECHQLTDRSQSFECYFNIRTWYNEVLRFPAQDKTKQSHLKCFTTILHSLTSEYSLEF